MKQIAIAAIIVWALVSTMQALDHARADVGAAIDRPMVERALRALEKSADASDKAARAAEKMAEHCR